MRAAGWIVALGIAALAVRPPAAAAQSRQDARDARVRTQLERAEALLRSGDRVSASTLLRQAIDIDPGAPGPYAALGRLELERDRPLRAVEIFRTGIERAQNAAQLLLGLAESLRRLSARYRDPVRRDALLREAREHLDRFRLVHPDDPRGHRERAELARATARWSEALASYRALRASAAAGAPDAQEADRWIAALELLVRTADPVTRPAHDPGCASLASLSPIRRALLSPRCPGTGSR
ncbi:MAG: hypothetical protein IT379_17495 [Deltaproteobacteria bacterium]|nr:hypothetical protein [Deltaproteobacteria bacterium]